MRSLSLAAAFAVLVAATGAPAQQPDKKADPKADPKKVDPKKADPKAKDEAEPKFTLKLKTSDIRLGTQLSGPKLAAPADLKGKVVLLDFWGVECVPCLQAMPGTAAMYAELADFGLVVVGVHAQASTVEKVKSVAAGRGANFPIIDRGAVTGANDFTTIPHVMVFDHTGACVFRGMPKEAELKARLAVGEMIVAAAGQEKFVAPLSAVAADLKKGVPPASVLPRVAAQLNGTKEAAADAKALLAALTAGGQKKFELAQEKAESEPLEAFLLVEKLPTAYKGSPLAKEAAAFVTKLKKEKPVAAELAARPALEAVKQFDAQLAAKPGADKANAADFQKANAALLGQMRAKVTQMKKSWPDAKATAEATEIADKYAP